MTSILEMLSDVEVTKAGKKAGSVRAKDNLLMRGMDLDYASVKWFIEEIMANDAGWFICTYRRRDGVNTFYIRHNLGHKWNIFIGAYLDAMIETILNVEAIFDTQNGSMLLKIPLD